jgi:iron complex transport system substrate-binding protein
MSLNSSPPDTPSGSRRVPLALFLAVVIVAAGISVAATALYFELRPAGAASSSLLVTDDLGRTVSVPRDPARVAVLSPSIMDSMARLGLRAHVVGVDCAPKSTGGILADYSSNQTAAWGLTEAMCIDILPTFDVEQLLNLTPTLVLASTIVSVSSVEELTVTYHLPVVLLQPPTLSGVLVDEQLLGTIFGVSSAANALSNQLQVQLALASNVSMNLTNSGASLPTVLLTYYATPAGSPQPGYWTFGPGTFGQSLIELAGGASISANATLAYPEVPGSQVLVANPSVVIYGVGFGVDLSLYAQAPDWSQLYAVSHGSAYAIDSTLITEPGPTMLLVGLHLILHLLHPSLVPT